MRFDKKLIPKRKKRQQRNPQTSGLTGSYLWHQGTHKGANGAGEVTGLLTVLMVQDCCASIGTAVRTPMATQNLGVALHTPVTAALRWVETGE